MEWALAHLAPLLFDSQGTKRPVHDLGGLARLPPLAA
jgi:hypothetical protein